MPGYHGIAPLSKLSLQYGSTALTFTVKDSIHTNWITGQANYPSDSGIVMNDEDYNEVKSNVQPENKGFFHIINFSDWMNSNDTVENVRKALADSNIGIKSMDTDSIKSLIVASRIGMYTTLKQCYSLFIFIMTIMGLLFFIASESVLFFKQYTEINSTKEKFYKLYMLGISKKEALDIISKELRPTFFAPLIFGTIMGYSFMYFMTFLVGGDYVIKEFMVNATVVVIAYFILQAVFYFITRSKYARDVLGNM